MLKIMKLRLLFFFLFILTFSAFSKTGPFPTLGFLLFKGQKEIILDYKQVQNGKQNDYSVKIKQGKFEGKDALTFTSYSPNSVSSATVGLDGVPLLTSIFDKAERARYIIKYGDIILLIKMTEDGRTETVMPQNAIDMVALSVLLSRFPVKQYKNYSLQLIDHKSASVKSVDLIIQEVSSVYEMDKTSVPAVKFKINLYLLYETVFYYSMEELPALLYYKGPKSINFFDETVYQIRSQSYLSAKKALQNSLP